MGAGLEVDGLGGVEAAAFSVPERQRWNVREWES